MAVKVALDPEHILIAEGEILILGVEVTVIGKLDEIVPLPQEFEPRTVKFPLVADELNDMATEFPTPEIVAPVPE